MAKKIIIFGFSHCGTSILKSIIGHIDEVYEIINECNKIDISTDKKFILCKTPKFNKIYLSDKYDSYIKIFIIRNPVYAYSSINERFNYNISKFHRLDKYFHTVNNFVELVNNPRKDIYTIKYEDLFDNNFKNLKSILDKIGFEYDDKIFDNSNYINKIVDDTKFESIKKKYIPHCIHRTKQINESFRNMNDINKIKLLESQKKEFLNNETLLNLYPEIKQLLS